MPEWLDSTIIIAIIAVIGVVVGHFLNRASRRDEVASQRTEGLIKNMGEQIDRLQESQEKDRERITSLELSHRELTLALWDEEHDNRKLRRGLGKALEDLDDVWLWVDSDRSAPPPGRPNLTRVRALMIAPRSRPPDVRARNPPEEV